MGCKHEGGKRKCLLGPNGHCKVAVKQRRARTKTSSSRDYGKAGAACELLVRADLSHRGYEVTVPVSATARHDCHVELPSVGWKGVQIKAARLYEPTNRLHVHASLRHVQSPIIALVFMPTKVIKYRAGTEPLPPELL